VNLYKMTFADGVVVKETASDMRALITVNDIVYARPEPVKVKLVKKNVQ
jgi:hypothetical protein